MLRKRSVWCAMMLALFSSASIAQAADVVWQADYTALICSEAAGPHYRAHYEQPLALSLRVVELKTNPPTLAVEGEMPRGQTFTLRMFPGELNGASRRAMERSVSEGEQTLFFHYSHPSCGFREATDQPAYKMQGVSLSIWGTVDLSSDQVPIWYDEIDRASRLGVPIEVTFSAFGSTLDGFGPMGDSVVLKRLMDASASDPEVVAVLVRMGISKLSQKANVVNIRAVVPH